MGGIQINKLKDLDAEDPVRLKTTNVLVEKMYVLLLVVGGGGK